MAAARMLSFGLSRALAGEASASASASDRRVRSAATVCQLSQRSPWESASLPRHGRGPAGADHECKVPAADSPHAMRGSAPSSYGEAAVVNSASEFVMEEAAVGRVECNSKGCRPCLAQPDPALISSWSRAARDQNDAGAAVLQSMRMATYQNRSTARDRSLRGPKPHFPLDFAEYLNEVWMEAAAADKYFAAALAANQHDAALLAEYAQFCWTSLSDADRAESLFNQALEQAPNDSDILASYANFLWQTDQ